MFDSTNLPCLVRPRLDIGLTDIPPHHVHAAPLEAVTICSRLRPATMRSCAALPLTERPDSPSMKFRADSDRSPAFVMVRFTAIG